MNAEMVFRELVMEDVALRAAISGELYAVLLPQPAVLPAAVYEKVSGYELPPISASLGQNIHRARIQLTIYAKTYREVKDIHHMAYEVLKYRSGTIAGVRVVSVLPDDEGVDSYQPDLLQYSASRDYMITHYQ
jgi:hypothetical protein